MVGINMCCDQLHSVLKAVGCPVTSQMQRTVSFSRASAPGSVAFAFECAACLQRGGQTGDARRLLPSWSYYLESVLNMRSMQLKVKPETERVNDVLMELKPAHMMRAGSGT